MNNSFDCLRAVNSYGVFRTRFFCEIFKIALAGRVVCFRKAFRPVCCIFFIHRIFVRFEAIDPRKRGIFSFKIKSYRGVIIAVISCTFVLIFLLNNKILNILFSLRNRVSNFRLGCIKFQCLRSLKWKTCKCPGAFSPPTAVPLRPVDSL